MSRGINKVILLGRLGADPETRYMPNGSACCSFQIATSESWKDKQTQEKKESVEWHKISTFNKLAEICAEYLKKGSQVYLSGKLKTRKWQDKDGKDRWTTEIICDEMQMLDSKNNADYKGTQQSSESYMPPAGNQSNPSDLDDDIPF